MRMSIWIGNEWTPPTFAALLTQPSQILIRSGSFHSRRPIRVHPRFVFSVFPRSGECSKDLSPSRGCGAGFLACHRASTRNQAGWKACPIQSDGNQIVGAPACPMRLTSSAPTSILARIRMGETVASLHRLTGRSDSCRLIGRTSKGALSRAPVLIILHRRCVHADSPNARVGGLVLLSVLGRRWVQARWS